MTRRVALMGNPNVGKSTIFNGLTRLRQHTGNWPGKTVTNAQGDCRFQGTAYTLVGVQMKYFPPKNVLPARCAMQGDTARSMAAATGRERLRRLFCRWSRARQAARLCAPPESLSCPK